MAGLWTFSYPIMLFIHLDDKGTKKWRVAQDGKLYMVASDRFSVIPALLTPKEGLSEAVVWGRLGVGALLHRGNNQARHRWREKIYKIYDSNQSGLALMYIQQLFCCLVQSKLSSG